MITPTSIKVYVIPANGGDPYLEEFPTIEAPILEPTYPDGLKPDNQARLQTLKRAAEYAHLVYDLPEGTQHDSNEGVYKGRYQPNTAFLPDTRKR